MNQPTSSQAVSLHCELRGETGGVPVVMLHGLSDSAFSFSRLLPLLPHEWRIVLPDLRGHGHSPKPAGDYSMDALAADVIHTLESRGIRQAVLCGHSLGSFIAQRIAVQAPALTAGLILMGSFNDPATPPVGQLASEAELLSDPVPRKFIREFQRSALHLSVPEDFFERVVEESLLLPAHVWRTIVPALTSAGVTKGLEQLRVPALLIWGELDAFFPADEQAALARRLAHAAVHILPGVGHTPHWEVPEACALLICGFVGGLQGARANPQDSAVQPTS